jgi:hypothetical protein
VGRDTLFHSGDDPTKVVDPPHRCSLLCGRVGRMGRDTNFVVCADEQVRAVAEGNVTSATSVAIDRRVLDWEITRKVG